MFFGPFLRLDHRSLGWRRSASTSPQMPARSPALGRELRADWFQAKCSRDGFTTVEGNLTLAHTRPAVPTVNDCVRLRPARPEERITITQNAAPSWTMTRQRFSAGERRGASARGGQRDPVIVGFTQYVSTFAAFARRKHRVSMQERAIGNSFGRGLTMRRSSGCRAVSRRALQSIGDAPLPACLYVVIFAYLGAPRTTNKAGRFRLPARSSAAMAVRTVGFIGAVAGARSTTALLAPF